MMWFQNWFKKLFDKDLKDLDKRIDRTEHDIQLLSRNDVRAGSLITDSEAAIINLAREILEINKKLEKLINEAAELQNRELLVRGPDSKETSDALLQRFRMDPE